MTDQNPTDPKNQTPSSVADTGATTSIPPSDIPPATPPQDTTAPFPLDVQAPAPIIEPGQDSGSAAPIPGEPPEMPKKKFGKGKIIATILGILVLVGGVGTGLFLVGQKQIFQPKAGPYTSYCNNLNKTSGCCYYSCSQKINCSNGNLEMGYCGTNCGQGTGNCGGGTQCTGNGYACTAASQCCSGHCNGICYTPVATSTTTATATATASCFADGTNCDVDSECCSRNCDHNVGSPTAGKCIAATSGTCSKAGDCSCTGANNYRWATDTTAGTHDPCKLDPDTLCQAVCAKPYMCSGGSCSQVLTGNGSESGRYSSASSCSAACGGTAAVGGTAADCGGARDGEACTSGTDCHCQGGDACTSLKCEPGVHQSCVVNQGRAWCKNQWYDTAGQNHGYTCCVEGYVCASGVNGCVAGATASLSSGNQSAGATAQCLKVKAYDTNWTELTKAQLEALTAGTKVRFTVGGTATSGSFDMAVFKINGAETGNITDKQEGTNNFFYEYTIPSGVTSFTVDAKIHHTELGWSNY